MAGRRGLRSQSTSASSVSDASESDAGDELRSEVAAPVAVNKARKQPRYSAPIITSTSNQRISSHQVTVTSSTPRRSSRAAGPSTAPRHKPMNNVTIVENEGQEEDSDADRTARATQRFKRPTSVSRGVRKTQSSRYSLPAPVSRHDDSAQSQDESDASSTVQVVEVSSQSRRLSKAAQEPTHNPLPFRYEGHFADKAAEKKYQPPARRPSISHMPTPVSVESSESDTNQEEINRSFQLVSARKRLSEVKTYAQSDVVSSPAIKRRALESLNRIRAASSPAPIEKRRLSVPLRFTHVTPHAEMPPSRWQAQVAEDDTSSEEDIEKALLAQPTKATPSEQLHSDSESEVQDEPATQYETMDMEAALLQYPPGTQPVQHGDSDSEFEATFEANVPEEVFSEDPGADVEAALRNYEVAASNDDDPIRSESEDIHTEAELADVFTQSQTQPGAIEDALLAFDYYDAGGDGMDDAAYANEGFHGAEANVGNLLEESESDTQDQLVRQVGNRIGQAVQERADASVVVYEEMSDSEAEVDAEPPTPKPQQVLAFDANNALVRRDAASKIRTTLLDKQTDAVRITMSSPGISQLGSDTTGLTPHSAKDARAQRAKAEPPSSAAFPVLGSVPSIKRQPRKRMSSSIVLQSSPGPNVDEEDDLTTRLDQHRSGRARQESAGSRHAAADEAGHQEHTSEAGPSRSYEKATAQYKLPKKRMLQRNDFLDALPSDADENDDTHNADRNVDGTLRHVAPIAGPSQPAVRGRSHNVLPLDPEDVAKRQKTITSALPAARRKEAERGVRVGDSRKRARIEIGSDDDDDDLPDVSDLVKKRAQGAGRKAPAARVDKEAENNDEQETRRRRKDKGKQRAPYIEHDEPEVAAARPRTRDSVERDAYVASDEDELADFDEDDWVEHPALQQRKKRGRPRKEGGPKEQPANPYAVKGEGKAKRTLWTAVETATFLEALENMRHSKTLQLWKSILLLHGEKGTESQDLKGKNGVQLKDKAVNIKKARLRDNEPDLWWYHLVKNKK